MAKSKETFNKKEREKQRQKQKQDKLQKKEERRAAGGGTRSFDDMIAYLDENGNLSSTPADPQKRVEIDTELLYTGLPVREPEPTEKTGRVNFFNDAKGFGFITDQATQQSIFVHAANLSEPIKEGDKVSFQTERGPRGPVAIQVKKIN